jgi:hypothetical protein
LVQDALIGAGLAKLGRLGEFASCFMSFAAGTPISTPAGDALIEDIGIGDAVLAADEETNISSRTVSALFSTEDRPLLRVTVRAGDEMMFYW